jgi:hypothetical protein
MAIRKALLTTAILNAPVITHCSVSISIASLTHVEVLGRISARLTTEISDIVFTMTHTICDRHRSPAAKAVYTGYWIADNLIWGPRDPGSYAIHGDVIRGPRNGGDYYIQNDRIYGPKCAGEFWIDNGHIFGPTRKPPWLE